MEESIHLKQKEWASAYQFLLKCGEANSPDALAQRIIDGIGAFIPYDNASVYLLDGSGKVCGHHLRGVDERWNKIYLAYYIHTDNERYSLFRKSAIHNPSGRMIMNIYNWAQVESAEFVPDFVQARGLLHTCGFGLYDLNNKLRISISLDRIQASPFSSDEVCFMKQIIPLLGNLHKNFYYQSSQPTVVRSSDVENTLTARESQITELLCQSLSPAEISQMLHIAQSTTYKHIANIYAKLNVSSQRQLLAKLLSPKE